MQTTPLPLERMARDDELPLPLQSSMGQDAKTRSVDLARRIIIELAESSARTKDGEICIGKDDILKITNKRRLYDVTGPLEAMGLIQTTKVNIIYIGSRIGSFSFVPPHARNANFEGRNSQYLKKYGRKMIEIPPQREQLQLPEVPKREKKHIVIENDRREKLKFLAKRKQALEEELEQKRREFLSCDEFLDFEEICYGVEHLLEANERNPNLFIVSGEHIFERYESKEIAIVGNCERPRLQEKCLLEFTAKNDDLEVYYIDNQLSTISPQQALRSANLRPLDMETNMVIFNSPDVRGSRGLLETPALDVLKFGEVFEVSE